MYRIIVTGWRGANADPHGLIIINALTPIHVEHGPEVTLVHGRCPHGGADLICDTIGRTWDWTIEPHPPEIRNGKILGPARNRHMCSLGANRVIAFPGPGSRGTWDCLRWAARFGIPFEGHPLS